MIDIDEHYELAERSIRTMKEVMRFLIIYSSFRRVPKFLTKRLVESTTINLSFISSDDNASSTLSPPCELSQDSLALILGYVL